MAKVKIALPEKFLFSTELTVRIGDVNYSGHLGNDSVLSLVHEARVRFFRTLGFTEADAGGPGIIMSDASVAYRSEGFQGDRLNVQVGIGEADHYRFELIYLFTNKETGKEVARVCTGIVFFDYNKRKMCKMPDAFAKKTGLA